MPWQDFPDPSLKPLVTKPRSPFFGLTYPAMRAVLQRCNAELIDVGPSRRVGGQATEGVVLLKQHTPQSSILIPIEGSLVFFEAKEASDGTNPHDDLHVDAPLPLAQLRSHFRYGSSVYPGEVGGVIGFATKCFKQIGQGPASDVDFSYRRRALAKANLLDLAGKWNLSGFATHESRIVSIDTESLTTLMNDITEWGNTVGWEANGQEPLPRKKPALTRRRLIRRCCEEAVIRFGQQLYRNSLIARGKYDRALAGHFFDYANSTGKRSITATNPRIAWYLHLEPEHRLTHVLGSVDGPNEKGYWRKAPPNGVEFQLQRNQLLKYYLEELKSLPRI